MRSSVTLLSALILSLAISFSLNADPVLDPNAIINTSINDGNLAQGYVDINVDINKDTMQLQNVIMSASCQHCSETVYDFVSYRQQPFVGNLSKTETDELSQLVRMNLTYSPVAATGADSSSLFIIPSAMALLAIICGVIVAYRPQRRHRHRV